MYVFSRFCHQKISGILVLGMVILFAGGCATSSYDKVSIKGPYIQENLAAGASAGTVDGGEFTAEGWKPGPNGTLTYDLPGMSQGVVECELRGLSRTERSTVLFTLYEPGEWSYADPYILHNPYRVTVTLKNYHEAPRAPFETLWTIKHFSATTEPEDRYVEGIPEDGQGFEDTALSSNAPIFPDMTYTLRLEWKHGITTLSLNGQVLSRQVYRPLLFNPSSLRLVLGRSPGMELFSQSNLVFSSAKVAFPGS